MNRKIFTFLTLSSLGLGIMAMDKPEKPEKPEKSVTFNDEDLVIGGVAHFTRADEAQIKLGNRIGRGAFGEVYEARAVSGIQGNYPLVVKLMKTNVKEKKVMEEVFLTEILSQKNKLKDSAHLVEVETICNLSQISNLPKGNFHKISIVLKRYSTDLERWYKKKYKDMSPEERRKFIRKAFFDIAKGLQTMHESGVGHQDMKPDNVFLNSGSMNCRVSDMGEARKIDKNELATSARGTPSTMAPECLMSDKKHPYSIPKADIWSLGAILYWLEMQEYPLINNEKEKWQFVGGEANLEDSLSKRDKRESLLDHSINKLIEKKKALQGKLTEDDRNQINLLRSLLHVNPDRRPTIQEVLEHPYRFEPTPGKVTQTLGKLTGLTSMRKKTKAPATQQVPRRRHSAGEGKPPKLSISFLNDTAPATDRIERRNPQEEKPVKKKSWGATPIRMGIRKRKGGK